MEGSVLGLSSWLVGVCLHAVVLLCMHVADFYPFPNFILYGHHFCWIGTHPEGLILTEFLFKTSKYGYFQKY